MNEEAYGGMDPADVVQLEAWKETRIFSWTVGPETTPNTVGVAAVKAQLDQWLNEGWTIEEATFLPSGPMNFRFCVLLVRVNQ